MSSPRIRRPKSLERHTRQRPKAAAVSTALTLTLSSHSSELPDSAREATAALAATLVRSWSIRRRAA